MHMPEVAIGYGMTETSPMSTISARDDPLERRVTTVGRVAPHVEVCIRDPATGAVLSRGKAGELCTRGYSVMRGYWDDAAATRAAIDAGGWMHSGDLAVLDDDGYVHIVGRLKDMIIRGGENMYPREVEAALHQHPAVSEAQVIGVPSRKYGEEIMAWVRLAPGAAATEEELDAPLSGTAGRVQAAALLALRRGVPNDGDGEGAEVPAAGDGRGAARLAGGGGGADGVGAARESAP